MTALFHSPCDPHYLQPKRRDNHLSEYYTYAREGCEVRREKARQADSYTLEQVTIARVCALGSENDDIHIDYYRAAGPGKFPAILISPVVGGKDPVARHFARTFARHGLHCAITHREKKPITRVEEIDHLELFFKNTIITIRHTLDWLTEREEVDAERIGSFGISFGAIKNVLAAGVDPRLKCHIFALAGGSLADIVCYSARTEMARWSARISKKHGMTISQFHQTLSRKISSDSLTLAEYVDARRVLMFIALFDRVVPRRCAENLWRSMGKPEVRYLPFGHYSALLTIPYTRSASLAFFQKCFGLPTRGNGITS